MVAIKQWNEQRQTDNEQLGAQRSQEIPRLPGPLIEQKRLFKHACIDTARGRKFPRPDRPGGMPWKMVRKQNPQVPIANPNTVVTQENRIVARWARP